MVPEIWSMTDIIFCHSGPFFALLPPSPPPPPMDPENQNYEKLKKKKAWRHHHFTQVFQISWSYAIYSLDMAHNRFNHFSFWIIFCPFTSLTAQKIKILQKWKKHHKITSFYNSAPKFIIMSYTVPEIWCVTDVIIFHFQPFFALLPP